MIGLVDRERVDEALYDDFESDKAREVISLVEVLPVIVVASFLFPKHSFCHVF